MGIERIKRIIIANELPIRVKRTACCPFLFNNMLWPGKIDKTESSSGAPRNIEGIKSRKVWVIDIATMNTIKILGGTYWRKKAETVIRETAMRFI